MIYWMMKKFIRGKGEKPTGLKRVTETLSFSTRKLRKGEVKILFWVFGMNREGGVMTKKVLPMLPYPILRTYTTLLT